MIRLLIADDHSVVRTGLRAPGGDVRRTSSSSGAAADGEEAVALCARAMTRTSS